MAAVNSPELARLVGKFSPSGNVACGERWFFARCAPARAILRCILRSGQLASNLIDRNISQMLVHISDDVVYRELSGESVLLNLNSGVYFGLDEVGTRMWYLLAEHGSTDKVITAMLDEYEVEEGQIRSDLDKLIEQLSEKGLVKTDAAETSPVE